MYSRSALLALAVLTAPLSAQIAVQGGIVIENAEGETVVVQAPEGAPPGVVMPPGAAGGAPAGDLDFNRLRQLIEESKKRPAPTPAQQKVAILRELQFDRSTSGILATRLEEARASDPPKEEVPVPPVPVPVPVP